MIRELVAESVLVTIPSDWDVWGRQILRRDGRRVAAVTEAVRPVAESFDIVS